MLFSGGCAFGFLHPGRRLLGLGHQLNRGLGQWISLGFGCGEPGLVDRGTGIWGESGWGFWIAMQHRLDAFARIIGSGVHVREEGDGGHVQFAGRGRDGGHDVAVLGHPQVRRTYFAQFLLEHLQQHPLAGRTGKSSARLIRLCIDLDVAQEPREQGLTHVGTVPGLTALVNVGPTESLLPLLLFCRRPVEHDNIANPGNQMAAALVGQLWGKFSFLLLEIIELHLDQLVMLQGVVQSGEELRADAFLADLERSLEALSLGLESADLGVGERNHG